VSTILVHPVTGGVCEAMDDGQVAALAKRGWQPADSTSVSKDDLTAQAKARGVTVDPKATKADIAKAVAHAAPAEPEGNA
jgi:hypothetical protein